MSLALITQPAFLRKHFFYTREGLLGRWPEIVRKSTSIQAEVVVQEPLPEIPEIEVVSKEEFPLLPPVVLKPTPVIQFDPREEQFEMSQPEITEEETIPTPSLIREPAAVRVRQKRLSPLKSAARIFLSFVMVASILISAVLILPEIYFTVFSAKVAVSEVADQAKEAASHQPVITPEPEPYMPPKNPDLPTGAWLSIPRIGVYSEMLPTLDPNEALDKGIWLVPDFGRPGDTTQPTIVAAHRYGWDWWWKTDYWKYNSFYLLTETQPGDRVEIIYDQRKWVYEIYESEEGELISDYDADLILYTCKYINSPIRYFRYARLIEE